MGLGGFQLRASIAIGPRVIPMFGQGLARPVGQGAVVVVLLRIIDEVDGQLPADNQLLQVTIHVLLGRAGITDIQGDGHRRNLAKMEVHGHM